MLGASRHPQTEAAASALSRSAIGLPAWWRAVIRFTRKRPLGAAGGLVILLLGAAALLADVIAPYDPLATDYVHMLHRPSPEFWLGIDAFGRDIFSRLLYGSRTALLVGFTASFVGASVRAVLGVVSAYCGGKLDLTIQRLMDILLAFPIMVLALAIVAVLGGGLLNLIAAIAVPFVPKTARVVRASALVLRQMPYVDAALALGASDLRVIFRHMLPNVIAPYLTLLTAFQGQVILLEASLSFLGLGVAEPTAAWGLMLKGSAVEFAERAPWMGIFPGLAISLTVFAFNLLSDAIRDALDPKLRLP